MSLLDELTVKPMPPGFDPGGFDCGKQELTDYLVDGTAKRDMAASVSRTYVIMHGEKLVGYFSILLDAIRLETKERPTGLTYSSAPALKLGRLGVCLEYQRRDIGFWTLDFVVGMARDISTRCGCRYVTLDAKSEPKLIAWYERYGFLRNKGETKARKFIRQALQRRGGRTL